MVDADLMFLISRSFSMPHSQINRCKSRGTVIGYACRMRGGEIAIFT